MMDGIRKTKRKCKFYLMLWALFVVTDGDVAFNSRTVLLTSKVAILLTNKQKRKRRRRRRKKKGV